MDTFSTTMLPSLLVSMVELACVSVPRGVTILCCPPAAGETSSAVAHTPPLGSPEEASSRAAGGREDSHRDLDSPEPEQEEEEEEEGEGSGRSVDHRQDKDLDPDLEDQDHDQESNQHQDRHQAIATELMQAVEEQVNTRRPDGFYTRSILHVNTLVCTQVLTFDTLSLKKID